MIILFNFRLAYVLHNIITTYVFPTVAYFFVTIRWKVKYKYRKKRYPHTRYDQIYCVK